MSATPQAANSTPAATEAHPARPRRKLSFMDASQLAHPLADFVRQPHKCRVGLVGLNVVHFGTPGPCTIVRTGWTGHDRLMVVIETPNGDDDDAIVPAEDLHLADEWPVTCCPASGPFVAESPHPLASIVLPLLWEVPGLDAIDLGRALSDAQDRDETSGAYEAVAADVLRVLHHHGAVDRDEAGRYRLAKPSCPVERAEAESELAENGEPRA